MTKNMQTSISHRCDCPQETNEDLNHFASSQHIQFINELKDNLCIVHPNSVKYCTSSITDQL